jgi:tetratricopeptide (TPR) repeat protein
MVEQLISRAEILIQQNRFVEAEPLLKDALAVSPNDIHVIYLLCESYIQQEKTNEANALLNTALFLDPSNALFYYLKSRNDMLRDKYDDAENHIRIAVKHDPGNGQFYAFWGFIKLMRKDYEKALELSNKALELEPESLIALNTRSTALLKLDRKEESFQTIEGALREDPNNTFTHSNYGWGLLEKGNHKKALEHFGEALQSDPTNDHAKAGLIEALKARYFIYRLYLKYAFWMGNMKSNYQWGFIIGFYIIYKLLISIAKSNPSIQPYLIPIIAILALAAFSTWVIRPIGNLFLRLNKYGVHLLDEKEKLSSSFVGLSFLAFAIGLGSYLITFNENFLGVAYVGFVMMAPLGSMLSPSKNKLVLPIYTGIMAVVGVAAILTAFATHELFNRFSVFFFLAFFVYQWVANFILINEDNR